MKHKLMIVTAAAGIVGVTVLAVRVWKVWCSGI